MGIHGLPLLRTRLHQTILAYIEMATVEDKKLTYLQMAQEAIKSEGGRTGASRQAILKYIVAKYAGDPEKAKNYVNAALKKGVESGQLKMAKESGKGAGCYKLGDVEAEKKKAKKPKNPSKPAEKTTKAKEGAKKTAKKPESTTPKKPKGTPTKKIGKKAVASATEKPKKAKK